MRKEKKKRKLPFPILAAIVFLLCLIFLIISFYYEGFVTLNRLLFEANQGTESIMPQEKIISEENYEKLIFVEKPQQDTFYVNGGCLPVLKKIGLGQMTFTCEADYTVMDPYTNEVLQEVKDQTLLVSMQFSDWKWKVTEIYR